MFASIFAWHFKKKIGRATNLKSTHDIMAGDVMLRHSLQYFVLWCCNVMYKCMQISCITCLFHFQCHCYVMINATA